MHWELKALLRAGWSFGLHWDAAADCFTAVARKGESVARNSSAHRARRGDGAGDD
jgi:hypothetical protein